MFFKKNPKSKKIIETLNNVFKDVLTAKEQDIREELRMLQREVQDNDFYNTNKKLEIYDLISKISNSRGKDREKYSKKLKKLI